MLEVQGFNEWLSNRRLRQEGETYADELARMTEGSAPLRPSRKSRRPQDGAGRRGRQEHQRLAGLRGFVTLL